MKNKRLLLYVVLLLVIIATLWSALPLHSLRPDWRIESEPMHSTAEALGALTGILMAVFLLDRKKNEDNDKLLLPPEPHFFDDKEIHLLDELSADISFALESM